MNPFNAMESTSPQSPRACLQAASSTHAFNMHSCASPPSTNTCLPPLSSETLTMPLKNFESLSVVDDPLSNMRHPPFDACGAYAPPSPTQHVYLQELHSSPPTSVLGDFSPVSPELAVADLDPSSVASTSYLLDERLLDMESPAISNTPSTPSSSSLSRPVSPQSQSFDLSANMHSERFPVDHQLDHSFVSQYELGDELGAGGFGFVMTARHRGNGYEVAVKFIIKNKIPSYAYLDDPVMGKIPTEIFLLAALEQENIAKCLDLFEDESYYYMVQELHGTPWLDHSATFSPPTSPGSSGVPELSPSTSVLSIESSDAPQSPPSCTVDISQSTSSPYLPEAFAGVGPIGQPDLRQPPFSDAASNTKTSNPQTFLPSTVRPAATRRPSHDLFECIETSAEKRLSEEQARPIFAQIVEAVFYLDGLGIAHRDIKDENILIDRYGKVKLIDFGSASVVDPSQPRPYYDTFFGTTAYASSEILLKRPYQAAPAEVWTLGVLLSYLLTGASPFPTETDAIRGKVKLTNLGPDVKVSKCAKHLLRICLDPDPKHRATIEEVRGHAWLVQH